MIFVDESDCAVAVVGHATQAAMVANSANRAPGNNNDLIGSESLAATLTETPTTLSLLPYRTSCHVN